MGAWKDLLLQVLVSEEMGVRHRAAHLMANLMECSKEFSDLVVSSQLFEVLMAISKVEGEENRGAKECAESALAAAAKHGLAQSVEG